MDNQPTCSGSSISREHERSPCAACKFLRRRCLEDCIFAAYFPQTEREKFINVHRIFGASNVAKLLSKVPAEDRENAVNSLAYEAKARTVDPVYGCVGAVALLQQQLTTIQAELETTKAQLAVVAAQNLLMRQSPATKTVTKKRARLATLSRPQPYQSKNETPVPPSQLMQMFQPKMEETATSSFAHVLQAHMQLPESSDTSQVTKRPRPANPADSPTSTLDCPVAGPRDTTWNLAEQEADPFEALLASITLPESQYFSNPAPTKTMEQALGLLSPSFFDNLQCF